MRRVLKQSDPLLPACARVLGKVKSSEARFSDFSFLKEQAGLSGSNKKPDITYAMPKGVTRVLVILEIV